MKYMLLFCGNAEDDARWRATPPDELAQAYKRVEEWFMTNGDKIEGGYELQGPETATTVKKDGAGNPSVTDGPFSETGEVVGGYCIANVQDLDEALAMAKSWPGAAVEVRPVVQR